MGITRAGRAGLGALGWPRPQLPVNAGLKLAADRGKQIHFQPWHLAAHSEALHRQAEALQMLLPLARSSCLGSVSLGEHQVYCDSSKRKAHSRQSLLLVCLINTALSIIHTGRNATFHV